MPAQDLLPTVAWGFVATDVTVVSEQTEFEPGHYALTAYPEDDNDPGAADKEKAVGYYIIDFLGRKYSIVAINVGSDTDRIEVTDDFRFGAGPQSGQEAVLFKSVGEGESPYLAPIYYRRLDASALEFSRQAELEVLWRNRAVTGEIPFTSVSEFSILDYQNALAPGSTLTFASKFDNRPKFLVLQEKSTGVYWERSLDSERTYDSNNNLLSVYIDLAVECSGKILITR
jgi:hypothetical protein